MFAFTSQAPGAVRPYMLLGAAPHEADYMLLKKLGVTHILQVGKELRPSFPDRFTYCRLALEDNEHEDLVGALPAAFAFIDAAREEGRRRQEEQAEEEAAAAGTNGCSAASGQSLPLPPPPPSPSSASPPPPPCVVLVHCMAGMSRSASVCVAYLMADPQERERAQQRERERHERHAALGSTPGRAGRLKAVAAVDSPSPLSSANSSPLPLLRPAGSSSSSSNNNCWGYEAAFRVVKAARPCVYPNLGFLLQLWDWEAAGCPRSAADPAWAWPGWNKHRFAERLAAYRRAQAAAGLHPAVRVKLPLDPPGAGQEQREQEQQPQQVLAAAAEAVAGPEGAAAVAAGAAAAAAAAADVGSASAAAAAAELQRATLQEESQQGPAAAPTEAVHDPELGGAGIGGGGWGAARHRGGGGARTSGRGGGGGVSGRACVTVPGAAVRCDLDLSRGVHPPLHQWDESGAEGAALLGCRAGVDPPVKTCVGRMRARVFVPLMRFWN